VLRCCVVLVALSAHGFMRELEVKIFPLRPGVFQRVDKWVNV